MGKKLDKALMEASDNPGLFIFHASDEYHHSESIRIKIGTDLLRALEEVISSRQCPYRTESDVIRDALFHRISWLSANYNPKWASTARAMKKMHLINALAESRRESARWMEDLEKNMNDYRTTERQKTELITDMYDTIMTMSSEEEERELWLKALRERYPQYVPKGFDMGRLTD